MRHPNLGGADRYEVARFGDLYTCDTIVAHTKINRGMGSEKDAIVMNDIATDMLSCYPVKDRTFDSTYNSFKSFAGRIGGEFE